MPRNTAPSSLPTGSQLGLEKKSSPKVVLAVLLSVPTMLVLLAPLEASVSTGKFCRLFGPESMSPASFAVTTFRSRSIPRLPLEKIESARMATFVPDDTPDPTERVERDCIASARRCRQWCSGSRWSKRRCRRRCCRERKAIDGRAYQLPRIVVLATASKSGTRDANSVLPKPPSAVTAD